MRYSEAALTPMKLNKRVHDMAAARTALEFSRGNVEPGPYYVVEVLRRPVVG